MFSKRGQRGFTLIEVIVMATVTSVGLLSIMLVADRTVRTSDSNENRVAGANLAREGVELVRAARDSNWQALGEQEEIGPPASQLQAWNCYANSQAQSFTVVVANRKPACDGVFGSVQSDIVNFQANPNTGNGVPYFTNESTTATTTRSGTYRLCQNVSGIFVPSPTGGLQKCSSGPTFYRRVSVQRGKNLHDPPNPATYNLLVKSYVTWPDNPAADIVIEEYLTDWRK